MLIAQNWLIIVAFILLFFFLIKKLFKLALTFFIIAVAIYFYNDYTASRSEKPRVQIKNIQHTV